jgi:hypothetical protein
VEQHVDVVTTLLEASATLAGLELVFLGMIATATASDAPGEARSVVDKARRPVYAILIAFLAGVLCVATAAVWLAAADTVFALYITTVILFFVQLIFLISTTSWSIRQVLRA